MLIRLFVLTCLISAAAHAGQPDAVYTKRATWAETMIATRESVARLQANQPAWPAPPTDWSVLWEPLFRQFWSDWPETEWAMQDSPLRTAADGLVDVHDFTWYFEVERDAANEHQMIQRVVDELGDAAQPLVERLAALVARAAGPDDPAWLNLYVEACQMRRAQRLELLRQTVPQFVFTKHYMMGGSHYAYTEGQSDAQAERNFVPGAALCLAQWVGDELRVETLIDDPQGVIRDPDVSYDGRRVLFAWKKSDLEDDYHLYEMDLESRAVRQLTHGLGVADYEGAYLPDGDIIFNSSRCVQIVDCWWTEVSNLYRCDRDGRFLRRVTFDQVHDNFPTVTDDGRILYTRWEYNDRGQIYPQPLAQMNLDGTNQCDFYGGNSWFPTTILHARGIPNTQKVVAIATGHHSRQTGKLIVLDPARGRQENSGAQLIAPMRDTPAVKIDSYGQEGELFQYPYPLSETEFLVTYHPIGWRWNEAPFGPRCAIYWMNEQGARERLVADLRLPCSQSVPVRARDVRAMRPSRVDYRQKTGTYYVQDVYAGPGLTGVARGTVKTLRVVELEFRVAGIGSNSNGGPGGGALISTPVAIGNGTWDPKRILGDVPVQEDGSAFFEVPARTPVYFQLLDERGRMVQTMRSWSTLQPGENASCVGCHEHKNSVPVAERPLTIALQQPPETLLPFYDIEGGMSFPRDIQPILDRHCTRCHDGRADVPYALTAREVLDPGAKRRWTESYLALTHARADSPQDGQWRGNPDHPLVCWVSTQSAPPMQPPYAAGANRSRLIDMLERGHEDVQLCREELDKLSAWIDLGVPFCRDYVEANTWTDHEWAKHNRYTEKRERLAAEDQRNIADWLNSQRE